MITGISVRELAALLGSETFYGKFTFCETMYDAKLDGRLYSYAFYAAAVAMFVASVLSFNAYLLALALVLLSLAALSYSSGHLLNNFILGSKDAATGLYGGFSVRERLSSAVRKNGEITSRYLPLCSARTVDPKRLRAKLLRRWSRT